MSLQGKQFKLADGNTIPAIAYGTGTKWFKFGNNEIDTNLVDAVAKAIELGFTHIDGAEIYNTDKEIGHALKKAGIKREDIYLTDKFFAGDEEFKHRSQYGNPTDSLKASLKNFQTDYVDLYLLHSPFIAKETHGYDVVGAWKQLEQLKDAGLAKSIGVSNFAKEDLEKILVSNPKHKPVVNQIEYSAYLQNQTPDIVAYSQKNGILVESYSGLGPLIKGSPGPLDAPLEKLAAKYSKSKEQVLLRWVLQQGVLPVTTSSKEERIKAYLEVFDFELTDAEAKEITDLGKTKTLRQYWDGYKKYDQ